MPSIPVNLEFDKKNYSTSENAIISLLGKPSEILKIMIINPSGNIIGEEIQVKLQEDGRATHELELKGFTSGIYTAVAQKGNSQNSEQFSVGLSMGSGPINIQTTQIEYYQGERILVIGSTNANVLLKLSLIDPNGVEIKEIEVPSKSDGTFTVDGFKIPTDAISGTWKINAISGSNSDRAEFEVSTKNKDSIKIEIGEIINIPGFGDSLNIGIIANQKTTITMQILSQNNDPISEILSCTPTAEFKCEILWTMPKELLPGDYIVRVSDSIITEDKILQIE